jgi:hypothetical protein
MNTRIFLAILLPFLAAPMLALPLEEVSEFERDGVHVAQRLIQDEGKLLYRYTLEADPKTKKQVREGHTFYMNSTRVFSIIETETRRIHGHYPGRPGTVSHAMHKDRDREDVWLADHAVENGGWMFVRAGARYFSYSPTPKEIDDEAKK